MVTPADPRQLTLVVGDTSGFVFVLYDERDENESLAGATRARFVMKAAVSDDSAVLDIDTDTELSIDTTSNEITVTLSSAQADALVAGVYVASLSVEFGAGNWKHSDRFYVKVLEAIAGNLA